MTTRMIRAILQRIKQKLRRRLRYDASVPFNPEAADVRHAVEWISVQPNVKLEVYWKVLKVGKGPAVSLYAFDWQILKADCFGPRDGHLHFFLGWPAPASENRLWLPEPSASAQIRRTVFELQRNISYYLQRHADEQVRQLQLDEHAWSAGCRQVEDRMLAFLQTVPELADLNSPEVDQATAGGANTATTAARAAVPAGARNETDT